MKKKIIILNFIILNLFPSLFAVSQVNLVPNPGFEIVNYCEEDSLAGGIWNHDAPPWDSPTYTSPDLFNSCCSLISGIQFFGTPWNTFGYQYAHSGNGYAGAGFCNTINYREYLQVKLDSELVSAQEYCASYYIVSGSNTKIASNNFGLYFSAIQTNISGFSGVLSYTPQINDTTIMADTLNWILITGHFIAQGGERYLIIGNFFPDSLTDTVHLAGTDNESYYYIDDVDVHCCTCETSHIGINEPKEEYLNVYPNPATNVLTIKTEQPTKSNLSISNVLGEVVFTTLITTANTDIDISSLPKGVYFIKLQTATQSINKKFIKE